jgi:hypothetical protein
MTFDPATVNDTERAILAAVAAGEWADFSGSREKPHVRAAFIRHVMLGLNEAEGTPWPVTPTGVRIRSIYVEGLLDLCDATGREGAALPALLLEQWDGPLGLVGGPAPRPIASQAQTGPLTKDSMPRREDTKRAAPDFLPQ